MEATALARRERLHRRGVGLERFTVAWNIAEAAVAVTVGALSRSVALLGFGVDSGIEVMAASALLWRFRSAGPASRADVHGRAEARPLYFVSTTFFFLGVYIAVESLVALARGKEAERSIAGVTLAAISLVVMPALAYAKQRTGRALASRALQADAIETWVCAYLSLALLVGVGLNAAFGVVVERSDRRARNGARRLAGARARETAAAGAR